MSDSGDSRQMDLSPAAAFGRAGYDVVRPLHESRGRVTLVLLRGGAGAMAVGKVPASPRAAASLAHEIEVLRSLPADVAPALLDVVDLEADGPRCPVLEFVHGISLDEAMRRAAGALSDDAVLGWCIDLCTVLHRLHVECGVVHRDVQPRHVLVRTDGAAGAAPILLCDFGAARRAGTAQPALEARAGDPAAAAPEQFGPEPAPFDPRVDVYGAGATLFRLLTGRGPDRPFRYPPLAELRPDLPPAVHAAVDRALRPRPDDRPPTALALGDMLARARAERSGSSWPGAARFPAPPRSITPGLRAGDAPEGRRRERRAEVELTPEERAALTGLATLPEETDARRGDTPPPCGAVPDPLGRALQRAYDRALAAGLQPQRMWPSPDASRAAAGGECQAAAPSAQQEIAAAGARRALEARATAEHEPAARGAGEMRYETTSWGAAGHQPSAPAAGRPAGGSGPAAAGSSPAATESGPPPAGDSAVERGRRPRAPVSRAPLSARKLPARRARRRWRLFRLLLAALLGGGLALALHRLAARS